MKKILLTFILIFGYTNIFAQEDEQLVSSKTWGLEFNVLWPIFPGGMYILQGTKELWRKDNLAGDLFIGAHIKPFQYREDEGDFSNYAMTFGYRQYVWEGLNFEFYNAFGPGYNRDNVITGKDYESWDYEVGLLVGYRYEIFNKEKSKKMKFSPYISTQQGIYYVAYKSNPHPIRNQTIEKPIYVGTLNIGILF